MAGGTLRIVLSCATFVFTGLVQTVGIQYVLYSGGGDSTTFLIAIPNYIGLLAVSFLGSAAFRLLDNFGVWASRSPDTARVHLPVYARPSKPAHPPSLFVRLFHRDRRKLFVLAFNELGGFLAGLTGLSIAGSGLYQVVFSGATVFTALLSTFFLKKHLSVFQWASVALITFGLMITAEQVTHSASSAAAASLISGIMFVLLSCMFYSTNSVIIEYFLKRRSPAPSEDDNDGEDDEPGADDELQLLPPPSSLDLSLHTGGTCLVIFGVYVLAHTVPHWHDLVTNSIERHHGDRVTIAKYYVYLMAAAFVHALTHYDVVATTGAVAVGVLNALRAVSVFGASSWLFCSQQASQCFTFRKGIATAIVISGAVGFSVATAVAERHGRSGKGKNDGREGLRRGSGIGRRVRRSVSVVGQGSGLGLKTKG